MQTHTNKLVPSITWLFDSCHYLFNAVLLHTPKFSPCLDFQNWKYSGYTHLIVLWSYWVKSYLLNLLPGIRNGIKLFKHLVTNYLGRPHFPSPIIPQNYNFTSLSTWRILLLHSCPLFPILARFIVPQLE